MSKTIFELKKESKNGAALKKLREKIYIEKMTEGDDLFLARAHKLTRLKKIGRADTKTLLQPEVAEAMSVRVKRDVMKMIEKNCPNNIFIIRYTNNLNSIIKTIYIKINS